METTDPKEGKAAFDAVLAKIKGRETNDDVETFAERLESQGVDVEVKPKPAPEPPASDSEDSEPAQNAQAAPPDAPEPVDPDADAEATDALLEAMAGPQAGEKRSAKMERRNAIEAELVRRNVPAAIANSIAHRTKLAEAEKYLAGLDSQPDNARAGLDASSPQGIPASSATPAGWATPEVHESLSEALGEAPASAIVQEFQRMRAELDAVKGQAQMSVEATKAQHRAAAQAALDSAVGELSGRFPELVRDGIVDLAVRQTAAAILHTPLIGGDLTKALEQAARMRFPEVAEPPRQTNKQPQTRDLPAPGGRRQESEAPLKPQDQFKKIAAVMGQHLNNPEKAVAEAQKLRRRFQ